MNDNETFLGFLPLKFFRWWIEPTSFSGAPVVFPLWEGTVGSGKEVVVVLLGISIFQNVFRKFIKLFARIELPPLFRCSFLADRSFSFKFCYQ